MLPLHRAAYSSVRARAVSVLLSAGASPTTLLLARSRRSALHFACFKGDHEHEERACVVRSLLDAQHGLSMIDCLDHLSFTPPLHLAAKNNLYRAAASSCSVLGHVR